MRRAGVPALVLLAVTALAPMASAQQPARSVNEQTVHDVASELRCVVCQNLSVADSPSEMAAQMRVIVRERLERGDSPAEVRQFFVERYGEWILLSPRPRGFNLLVWLFPAVAVLAGLVAVVVQLRRWTRRRPGPPVPVDRAMSERIRREMEQE